MSERIQKTDDQWREELPPDVYHVTRNKGTEAPFTGEYCHHKDDGMYHCVCCGAELFPSHAKFDSGSGWPSFHSPTDTAAVDSNADHSHGMIREEIVCSRCGAHLGHVFPDGPHPTGQRYCVNSASLKFQPKSSTQEG